MVGWWTEVLNAIGGCIVMDIVNQGFLVTGRQPDIHSICPSQPVKSHFVDVVPHNGETRYKFI